MKRLRLPRPRLLKLRLLRRRLQRRQLEGLVVGCGFFGGLAICSAAIALVYLPAGLFFAGAASTTLTALYARPGKREPEQTG